MKQLKKFLLVVHIFVGIGAVFGGIIGVISPDGSAIGMPVDVLRNGPFTNFLIPSIFLLTVLGIGNLAAAYIIKVNWTYRAYVTGIFGSILCMWIIIQCYIMWAIAVLHIIFFVVGVIQLVLAAILAFKTKLFPTQYIIKALSKIGW